MVVDSGRCSSAEFAAVQETLRTHGIAFKLNKVMRRGKCVVVEFGTDAKQATDAARAVLMEAFGASDSTILRSATGGVFDMRGYVIPLWNGWPWVTKRR